MKLLNEIFRERVISRNLWPTGSPDLTPPDFYLWGAAKSAVYRDCPRMLNELENCNNCVHKKHHTSRSAESVCE